MIRIALALSFLQIVAADRTLLTLLAALAILVLVVRLARTESRRWVTGLAVLALVLSPFLEIVAFALLTVIAAALSSEWRNGSEAAPHRSARVDRALGAIVAALALVQVVVGTEQERIPFGLALHLLLAFGILMTALPAGARSWMLYGNRPAVARGGKLLLAATGVQMALGALALLDGGSSLGIRIAHRAVGALLLAAAFLSVAWERRFVTMESR